MSDLYELRLYVSKPGMFPAFHEQWETAHYDIYADFHTLLGAFDARRNEHDASDGFQPDEPAGIALVLAHDSRAAVDEAMNALVASNRMNEVPGPPGPAIVDHWERTFLYPLVPPADLITGSDGGSDGGEAVYEVRTLHVRADGLDELVEAAPFWPLDAGASRSVGLFVSHPEHDTEPDGLAVLLRHPDLATATSGSEQEALAAARAAAGTAAVHLLGCTRRLLQPLARSGMR